MAYLLDTHTILWSLGQHHKLSEKVRNIIEDPGAICYTSYLSFFEMAIKKKTGKLELLHPISRYYNETQKIGIQTLTIKPQHLDLYDELPLWDNHRDPFDRMLIATAVAEALTIISIDKKFTLYNNVQVIW
ncbi:PIN domain nuclease, a component of toxin-antitoxin system (PIN domain) [Dyadobacter soli]|uniref:PIN domain nuclease, a component of toxin-antitoxin system (PIN domain) n=1 Tax=Dyadobacter soli TaxID=659014 RepID=A0A1G7YI87_9BACT|nr:type II toxin-antitoxin system VapC family toxin [Dyadobacter soli]SDG95939.1 PIN domain nuclease, a component of toxin-antitoxin system (PIN domain) [Dyadobacter soli]